VPEWLLDTGISSRAVHLYVLLGRYADRNGESFPSRRTLAERLGCSVDSLDRAKAELIEVGALSVEERFDAGQRSNLYTILRLPSRTGAAPPLGTGAAQNENHVERGPSGDSAQALVAYYVDASREIGVDPPRKVVGHVAKEVAKLLDEGQPPLLVSRALALLIERRLNPSTLPSLILEAGAGPARRRRIEEDRPGSNLSGAVDAEGESAKPSPLPPPPSEEERQAALDRLAEMQAAIGRPMAEAKLEDENDPDEEETSGKS
jgi:hypothetical protein